MRRLVALVLAASLAGCHGAPQEKEATDAELAPVDQSPNPTMPTLQPTPPPDAAAKKSSRPEPIHGEKGVVATIVYVTEIGNRGGARRPGAVIFSSDTESPYLQERPRPSRILKPQDPGRLGQILGQLREAGLERLPPEAQLLEEAITPDRQIIVIRDGKRVTYRQSTVKANADAFKVFAECEKVLVDASHERDEYVETMGRDNDSKYFKPLNPGATPGTNPEK